MKADEKISVNPKKETESLDMTVTEEEKEPIIEDVKESQVKIDFDNLCRELNMDLTTSEQAWKYYCETKHKYTLEVRLQSRLT